MLLAAALGLFDEAVYLAQHALLVLVGHAHYLGLQQPHSYRFRVADHGTQAAAIALTLIDRSLELLGLGSLLHLYGFEEAPLNTLLAAGTELLIDFSAKAALLQYLLYVTNLHANGEDVTAFPAAAAYCGQLFRCAGGPGVNQACFLRLTGDRNGLLRRDTAAGATVYGILCPSVEMQADVKRESAPPDRPAAGTRNHGYWICSSD